MAPGRSIRREAAGRATGRRRASRRLICRLRRRFHVFATVARGYPSPWASHYGPSARRSRGRASCRYRARTSVISAFAMLVNRLRREGTFCATRPALVGRRGSTAMRRLRRAARVGFLDGGRQTARAGGVDRRWVDAGGVGRVVTQPTCPTCLTCLHLPLPHLPYVGGESRPASSSCPFFFFTAFFFVFFAISLLSSDAGMAGRPLHREELPKVPGAGRAAASGRRRAIEPCGRGDGAVLPARRRGMPPRRGRRGGLRRRASCKKRDDRRAGTYSPNGTAGLRKRPPLR